MSFLFSSEKAFSCKHKPFPTGQNIGIAFLDTGISPMKDFTQPHNRIVAFRDFISGKVMPYDDNGHGTHVAGIACGNGLLSKGKYQGIAPNANIIALKILDKDGQGSSSHAVFALTWILDNASKYNIKVVNLSIGSNDKKINYPLKESVEKLWKKGIVVIAAAANPSGNEEWIQSPPLSPSILTIGAWEDKKYFPKEFHLYGRIKENTLLPTLFAPGEHIISLLSPHYRFSLPSRSKQNIIDTHYIKMSGASMATPFISGLSALLLERYPHYDSTDIKKILVSMAHENNGLLERNFCLNSLENLV